MTVSKTPQLLDASLARAHQQNNQLKFFSVMCVLLFIASLAFGSALQVLSLFLLFLSFVSATLVVYFVWSTGDALRAMQIERNLQMHQEK